MKEPRLGDITRRAKELVIQYANEKEFKGNIYKLTLDDTYVVWFSKTLQNWKALVSTVNPGAPYYEVTYDGDKKQAYIDVYRKWDNVCVNDEE